MNNHFHCSLGHYLLIVECNYGRDEDGERRNKKIGYT
jgi:hypothetical protein